MSENPVLSVACCFRAMFQKFAVGFFAIIVQPANATEQAAPLPPILNYHPLCEPTVLKEHSQIRYLEGFKEGDADSAATLKADLLKNLRQKAAAQNADALILNKVQSSTEYVSNNLSLVRLKIEAKASFLKFCPSNSELSTRPTRWNEDGMMQALDATSYRFSLTSSGPASPTPATASPPLSQDISLATGVFGIQPGMSKMQVEQLTGKADAEIQLQNGLTAHGYGRQLWLIFNETLLQIQTDRRFLSGYGQNLLALHDHFDSNDWRVAAKVKYKTTLADVRQQLPEVTDAGSDQLQLKNQHHQLLLTFDKYNPAHQQPAVSMLTGFILKNAHEKLRPLQLPIVKPELYYGVLQQLQPKQIQQSPLWSALSIPPALPQHQFKTDKEQWRILGDYLQLQVEDDQVKKLRIADSIFYRPEQPSVFLELYQALGLPVQKQQLLDMFSDGELYHQQFNLYRDSFQLQISFDSDADDAKPEEVILSYF